MTQILIVGAGPTGLTVACELWRHGIPCRLVDKREGPIETSNALAVHARTMEVWQDMGLIEKALAEGHKIQGMHIHSSDKELIEISLKDVDSSFPFVLAIPQATSERLLLERLQELGGQLERGLSCQSVQQTDEGVEVGLSDASGKVAVERFDYVVGCDGMHSAVREQCQIPFEGDEFEEHFIMADIHFDWSLGYDGAHAFFSEQGPMAVLPLSSYGFGRIIFEVTNDPELSQTKDPVLKDFQRLAANRCSVPIELSNPTWTSGFWIHRRLASTYQYGRIFLAGDAAHVHSPVGGQGMNTGIQDAYNLAWKLAMVLKGRSGEQLLDSYEAERKPVAEAVLDETTRMTELVSAKGAVAQWFRNQALLALSHVGAAKQAFARNMAETTVEYKDSPIVWEAPEGLSRAFLKGPAAGQHLIDGDVVTLHGNTERLSEILKGPSYHLLMFPGEQVQDCVLINQWVMANWDGDMHVHVLYKEEPLVDRSVVGSLLKDPEGRLHAAYGAASPCLYLIRPDKYIAYRAEGLDLEGLMGFLN